MILENLRLALKDLTSNKMRTFLSALGIVIGVASVIAITTLGQSATYSIQVEVADAGLETISVMPGRDSDRETRRLFTPELADEIAEIEGIEAATAVNSGSYTLQYGRESYTATVIGADESFAEIYGSEAETGRLLTAEDDEKRSTVLVLGAELATYLFPDGDALGKYVRVYRNQAKTFKVIGVLTEQSDTMGMSFDTSAYIPYETYAQRLEKVESAGRYSMRTQEGVDVLEVADRVETYFLDLTGNEDSFRVMSPSTMADMFTGITETLNLFLTGIAAISLIVGGIGIMNIMLVSVTERTREIGIRKALGAAPRVIRGQFLSEAVTLTVLGGVVGMTFGTLISLAATNALGWSFAVNPGAYALALVFSSAVGVFFGMYPAVRASRLDPVAALAYE
jgi:putative ABC transport system permease protein